MIIMINQGGGEQEIQSPCFRREDVGVCLPTDAKRLRASDVGQGSLCDHPIYTRTRDPGQISTPHVHIKQFSHKGIGPGLPQEEGLCQGLCLGHSDNSQGSRGSPISERS